MKGGTLGNMERRRGERSSNAILTFASFRRPLMLPVTSFPLDLVWLSVTLLLVLTPCTLTHRSRRTMLSSKPLIDMKSQLGSSDSIRSARVSLASFHPGAFNFSTVRWSPWNYFFLKQISLTLPLIRIATMSLAWGQIAACQMRVRYWRESGCYVLACLPARLTNNKKADKMYWRDPTPENFIQPLAL